MRECDGCFKQTDMQCAGFGYTGEDMDIVVQCTNGWCLDCKERTQRVECEACCGESEQEYQARKAGVPFDTASGGAA